MHYWGVKVNPFLLLFGTTANLSSLNLIPKGVNFPILSIGRRLGTHPCTMQNASFVVDKYKTQNQIQIRQSHKLWSEQLDASLERAEAWKREHVAITSSARALLDLVGSASSRIDDLRKTHTGEKSIKCFSGEDGSLGARACGYYKQCTDVFVFVNVFVVAVVIVIVGLLPIP